MIPATGIILTGGRSSRFGSNKALAPWRGGRLIASMAANLKDLFPRVLIVAKEARDYSFLKCEGVSIVEDRRKSFHPLCGFESGLQASRTRDNFITACDMPFLSERLLYALWKIYQGRRAAIARWGGAAQPLFGFYSKECLGRVEKALRAESSLEEMAKSIPARILSERTARSLDIQGRSFFDLDTRQDYDKAVSFCERV